MTVLHPARIKKTGVFFVPQGLDAILLLNSARSSVRRGPAKSVRRGWPNDRAAACHRNSEGRHCLVGLTGPLQGTGGEPALVCVGGWLPAQRVVRVRFLPMCGIDNRSNGHPQNAPMDISEGPPSKPGGREPDRTSVALPFWAGLALGWVQWFGAPITYWGRRTMSLDSPVQPTV